MERGRTKERILEEAVELFAREGYAAVSVEQIAGAVGIKAPSLYKHFKSKRDIFDGILRRMEQQDREQAQACAVPADPMDVAPEAYGRTGVAELVDFSRAMFRYWTEDPFAAAFRRMLTVEQYRSDEMKRLYHQYLGAGPLGYVADLLGSREDALAFYGPMYLLYGVYDAGESPETVQALLEAHFARWLP